MFKDCLLTKFHKLLIFSYGQGNCQQSKILFCVLQIITTWTFAYFSKSITLRHSTATNYIVVNFTPSSQLRLPAMLVLFVETWKLRLLGNFQRKSYNIKFCWNFPEGWHVEIRRCVRTHSLTHTHTHTRARTCQHHEDLLGLLIAL